MIRTHLLPLGLFFGLLFLSSCAPEGNGNPLIGIWETTALINSGEDKTTFFNNPSPVWVELHEDGSYTGGGGKLESDEGVYFISGDSLLFESNTFVNKEAWLFKINGEKMECTGTTKYQMKDLKMTRKKVASIPD